MLAKNKHAYTAKVASDLASKSYNSTTEMYYYGVTGHVVARKLEGRLPDLKIIFIKKA